MIQKSYTFLADCALLLPLVVIFISLMASGYDGSHHPVIFVICISLFLVIIIEEKGFLGKVSRQKENSYEITKA